MIKSRVTLSNADEDSNLPRDRPGPARLFQRARAAKRADYPFGPALPGIHMYSSKANEFLAFEISYARPARRTFYFVLVT